MTIPPDPLAGTPIRDAPGAVRDGKSSGPWVKVGGSGAWVSLMTGETVTDWLMHLLELPVTGTVPGSMAATREEQLRRWLEEPEGDQT